MTQKLATKCPHCDRLLRVAEDKAGRRVRCPACREPFTVQSLQFSRPGAASQEMEALETRQDAGTDSNSSGSTSAGPSGDEEKTIGRVGRFEIKSALGQGAFGTVYRAYDPVLDRQVALKIPRFTASDSRKARRFVREAKAAASLHHPNIVAVFESGRIDGKTYIASELIEGTPMSTIIRDRRPDFRQSAEWVALLAEALAYAHDLRIVHRDIKPDNIMVGSSGNPQIMDFGLAKRLDEDSSMTTDGGVLGTPAYMPPEQARGETDRVGPHSDQYSLGVVLYELLTGQRPFSGPPHSVIAQVASEDPPEPRELSSSVPVDLSAICTKAMQKQPEQRYATVADMATDLERWLTGRETAARPIGRREKISRWARRNRALALSLSTLMILMLVWLAAASFATVYFREQERIQSELAAKNQELAESNAGLAELRQAALTDATAATRIAEKRLVEQYLSRGRSLCEAGDAGQGLHWLALALQNIPDGARDLEMAIRRDLNAFSEPFHRLRRILPLGNEVTGVSISPDGQAIAAVTGNWHGTKGSVFLFDATTGEPLASPMGLPHAGWWVDFSADGRLVLTGYSDYTTGQVRVFDRESGEWLDSQLAVTSMIRRIDRHPTRTLLAMTTQKGMFRIWDWSTGELITPPLQGQKALQITFSPDGRTLAVSTESDTLTRIRFWDVDKQEFQDNPVELRQRTAGISFSSDGSRLVGLTMDDTRVEQVALWDVATRSLVANPFGVDARSGNIRFHPSEQLVVVTSWDGTAVIYNPVTGNQVGPLLHHRGRVREACFNAEGTHLLTAAEDGNLRVWELGSEIVPLELSLPGQGVHNVDVSATDETLLVAPKFQRPRVVSADGLQIQRQLPQRGYVHGVATAGTEFAFTSSMTTHEIKVWNLTRGSEIVSPLRSELQPINLACDTRGRELAIACGKMDLSRGQLLFWNLATGSSSPEPIEHNAPIPTVRYSPNGRYLATGTTTGLVQVFDAESKRPLYDPLLHPDWVVSLDFSIDGETLATSCHDGLVRFFEASTGRPDPRTLDAGTKISVVRFAPDGRLIALGTDSGLVQLWDLATYHRTGRTVHHPNAVTAVSFLNRQQRLITCCTDKVVRSVPLPDYERRAHSQLRKELEMVTGIRLSILGVREFQSATDRSALQSDMENGTPSQEAALDDWFAARIPILEAFQANRQQTAQRWNDTLSVFEEEN